MRKKEGDQMDQNLALFKEHLRLQEKSKNTVEKYV